FSYVKNYDQSRPLLPYLYRIAHRVFLDFVKDRQQEANLPFDAGEDLKFFQLREQQIIDFVKEQANLDESQCELFVMLVFYELSPKEIACMMGISPKSARQRIWKLRKLLRDRLDRDDFSSPWY